MNAAIRAIVRTAVEAGFEAFGVRDGFEGLMEGRFVQLGARDVGGIIQFAGTLLCSARAPEFATDAGQRRALDDTLELIRRQGYALRDKSVRPVSRTLAVPVFDASRVVASVGVTWFASTMSEDKAVATFYQPLRQLAEQAQAKLANA